MRIQSLLNVNAVVILMLHGIMDENTPSRWRPLRPRLSRRAFRGSLETLSRFFRFVSLEHAVQMISGRSRFLPNTLVLTFDDGYRNQLKHALPILEEFKAPGIFFLATGHIEQRRPFWFDRIDYALQHAAARDRKLECLGEHAPERDLIGREAVAFYYRALRRKAKQIIRYDEEMITELENIAELLENENSHKLADFFESDDWSALMCWEEIESASNHPLVTFGSHTVDHSRMGLLDDRQARLQGRESKKLIEKNSGKECRFFCYPSGSFNPSSSRVLRECGYEAAATTLEGLNDGNTDHFALRRIHVPTAARPFSVVGHALKLHLGKSFPRLGRRASLVPENRAGE